MTNAQWETLLKVIAGEPVTPLPVGLIVDCPWLPGWAGVTILDYLTDDRVWLDANLRAVNRFPDVMLLPGFWAEYGMCTEPAAFGAVHLAGERLSVCSQDAARLQRHRPAHQAELSDRRHVPVCDSAIDAHTVQD